METGRRAEPQHVDVVRKCVAFGFWLLAAGAAATLGLDLEFDVRS
jgi:hypothetical protein